jgi:SAM-dependent methyltransferase
MSARNSAQHGDEDALTRLLARLQPLAGARTLSLAADDGRVAQLLAQHGAQVVSATLRADEHAQDAATYSVQFEMTRLPFRAQSMALIVVCDAARRLADVPRFLSECARVLSPAGKLALIEPLAPVAPAAARYVNAFERLRDPSHMQQFNLMDWKRMLHAAALELTHYEILVTHLSLYCAHSVHYSAETLLRLRVLLHQAPQAVREFLKPSYREDGNGDVSFERPLLILIARKAQ